MTEQQIIKKLKSMADPKQLEGMARFGLNPKNRLGGITVTEMRKMAKGIEKDHQLALDLWKTEIKEARIVAVLVEEEKNFTEKQAEAWVKQIDSWDICDHLCMNLLDRMEWTDKKIREWSKREEEFVKRAAYAMIASVAVHDKEALDGRFIKYFAIIKKGAQDERNYVKKAVSWALRSIGKRNKNLNKKAIKLAQEIKKIDNKAACWVGSDVLRELQSEKIKKRIKN